MGVKKFFVHKKYLDEVWGKLLFKNFSYVKNSVFENYKKRLFRRFFLRSYYRYFKTTFFDKLNMCKFSSLNNSFVIKRFLLKNIFYGCSFHKSINPLRLGAALVNTVRLNESIGLISKLSLVSKVNYLPVMQPNSVLLNELALRSNIARFYFIRKSKITKNKGFFYSTHIATPAKKKKPRSLFFQKHAYYKKISTYFGFKKISSFIKFYKSFNNFKLYEFNLYTILFCKLDSFLHTLNLFPSIYFIKKFIHGGNVFLDNIEVNFSNYIVPLNRIVTCNKNYFKKLYFGLLKNLSKKRVFLNSPSYIEVDYKTFSAVMFKFPDAKLINKPFSFNLYTKFFTPAR